jgi:hypothetical protein
MKLKITRVVVLGVAVLLLVISKGSLFGSGKGSPTTSNETTALTQYVDSQAGFKITLPKAWEKVATQPGNLADFKASSAVIVPGTGAYSPYIAIVSAPAQFPGLDALVSADISSISLQTINFLKISSTPETIDGQPASLLTYSFRLEGTPPLTNAQLIVVKNNTEYGITGTSLTSDWPRYSDAIQKALLSFQI